jgi:hypothetical protein
VQIGGKYSKVIQSYPGFDPAVLKGEKGELSLDG